MTTLFKTPSVPKIKAPDPIADPTPAPEPLAPSDSASLSRFKNRAAGKKSGLSSLILTPLGGGGSSTGGTGTPTLGG